MNLYDKASLIITPNAYKASKLYAVKPSDGTGDLTVARAGVAMRRNSAGTWVEEAANVPRLHYPVGGGCSAWLLEPQRTNNVLYSTDFSNAAWAVFGTAAKAASALATNIVGVTPYDITGLGANGVDMFYQVLSVAANSTYQIFIKAKVAGDVGKTILFSSGGGAFAVDIVLTADWQEYSVFAAGAGTNIYLSTGDTGTPATQCTISYVGAEVGVTKTSPIITTSAAVTRLGDVASKTGIAALIGQTEGTMYWEGNLPTKQDAATKELLRISGTKTVRITTYGTVINIISVPIDFGYLFAVGAYAKIAVTYNDSGVLKCFINGVIRLSVTTYTPGTFDTLLYGNINQSDALHGPAMLCKTALTDAECVALTTL